MNLKESFRYQKFLDLLMVEAKANLTCINYCLSTTKTHHRHDINPDAEDIVETVDVGEFVRCDVVMDFMKMLVEEKEKLSTAIGLAKTKIGFDLDAAIETNKFRQDLSKSLRVMTRCNPTVEKTQGIGYKFDINGVQTTYRYDVDIATTINYDKEKAKKLMRDMISEADRVSAAIDAAMINTEVDYNPEYDVNEDYDDVILTFIVNHYDDI